MKKILLALILVQTVSMATTHIVHDVYINNGERILVISDDKIKRIIIKKNSDIKDIKSKES